MEILPLLVTDNNSINRAYRLALGTLVMNINPYKHGILKREEPVIFAGMGYDSPWTRDAAINTWNCVGLLYPEVAKNTLQSVLINEKQGTFIDGEYWDKIIWTIGAWYEYLYTGDKNFLQLAYDAVSTTLDYLIDTEYSVDLGLFRGPACYGDGVSAYPDIYAEEGESGIESFERNRALCEEKGVGIPMYVLSTNCLYYYSLILADKMLWQLSHSSKYSIMAERVKASINEIFWSNKRRNYNYIYDKFGGCDYQESLGVSMAILFGIADKKKIKDLLSNQHIERYGIPCVYPSFSRYHTVGGQQYGRHSGTVWPHIQGFWASAAAEAGASDIFDQELLTECENALRYHQFAEVYHPQTGQVYGGRQEDQKKGIREWNSEPHQTWSATAFLRNIYMDVLGLKFNEDGIVFKPIGCHLFNKVKVNGINYRKAILNITILGNGSKINKFYINGKSTDNYLSSEAVGEYDINIILSEA